MNRRKEIAKTSVVGIVTNLVLVGIKTIVGLISGSISILSDALNNLTDAISSIVTIVGTTVAMKKPDKNHPYGYGKIEHLAALAIGVIIFGTGVSLIIDSVEKIIEPEVASFNLTMIFLIIIGILIKLWLGLFVQERGKKLRSGALVASGKDALFDVLVSFSTLVGAVITLLFGVTIDGWIGLIISVLILKTAIEIARDNLGQIIGARIDAELSGKIKKEIAKDAEILGVYDLVLHQYGPETIIGSVHIEVDDDMKAREIHELTRAISERVFRKYGVVLTVGIYASNTGGTKSVLMKQEVQRIVQEYKNIIEMHGFYVDTKKKVLSFDLVFKFEEKEAERVIAEITKRVNKKYPDYQIMIIPDNDYTD
ncbi:cation transporter [Candidatus Saccharibacteria bacterium]|nr:cation transporter [Candidatus Saccharibacteria bacterium]